MGEKELKTEQAVINRFQELRNELSVLSGRANELASESREHDLVLKALEPMDGDRKCYRVVCCTADLPDLCTPIRHFQCLECTRRCGEDSRTDSLRCMQISYHLLSQVGEILVERTVAEVKPAVKGNKKQLDAVSMRCTSKAQDAANAGPAEPPPKCSHQRQCCCCSGC